MQWREPVYLWALIIPLMILVGWIVAERRRRHRLATFGDPRLLGVSLHAVRQLLTIVLLTLIIGSTIAVLALPVNRTLAEEVHGAPLVAILLDARMANSTRS